MEQKKIPLAIALQTPGRMATVINLINVQFRLHYKSVLRIKLIRAYFNVLRPISRAKFYPHVHFNGEVITISMPTSSACASESQKHSA